MKRRVLIFVSLLLLVASGCTVPFAAEPHPKRFFVLSDGGADEGLKYATRNAHLLIRESKATPFLSGQKIVFSDAPAERGYYRFASWVEPVPGRLTLLLLQRIEKSEIFETVSRLSATRGDYQLNTEIGDFYHDVSERTGVVRIAVRAELIKMPTRKIVSQRDFKSVRKVKRANAEAAVQAFNEGVAEILTQLIEWLSQAVEVVEIPDEID